MENTNKRGYGKKPIKKNNAHTVQKDKLVKQARELEKELVRKKR